MQMHDLGVQRTLIKDKAAPGNRLLGAPSAFQLYDDVGLIPNVVQWYLNMEGVKPQQQLAVSLLSYYCTACALHILHQEVVVIVHRHIQEVVGSLGTNEVSAMEENQCNATQRKKNTYCLEWMKCFKKCRLR